MLKVTTKLTHDANGNSRIVAKADGRQLTHKRDLADSFDRSHGLAAGALLVKLGYGPEVAESFTHTVLDATTHTFTLA